MATQNIPLPAGVVVDIAAGAGLVDGDSYSISNAGRASIIYGEYAPGGAPDPFAGHPLPPRSQGFQLTANAAEPLHAMAVSGDSGLAISGAG